MNTIIVDSVGISLSCQASGIEELYLQVEQEIGLDRSEFYFLQNGKKLTELKDSPANIYAVLRLVGGKGGFGSMLRAIGAQIEKTTNREACRDLSGRRLRDINEEKRIRDYLEKQKNAPEDEKVKFQKKIDKLLAKPKHDFKDETYEQHRSELTQNIDEAVTQGFQKAIEKEAAETDEKKSKSKRKSTDNKNTKKNKKKCKGLWIGTEDLSSSSETDASDTDTDSSKKSGSSKESEKVEK